ncbi:MULTISPECIES: vWA domain-containing protein [unclassified Sphingomonas]|uniref:vWA domain-containing protein n=1 Tax=unclassified Sphingomonas TaxID=196159 RepID=UPI000A4F8346|nr:MULTISPECIES: VWA domain-containing protein [unclassified Sphingomonas]
MSRYPAPIAIGLTAMLLASCASPQGSTAIAPPRSSEDMAAVAPPPPPPAPSIDAMTTRAPMPVSPASAPPVVIQSITTPPPSYAPSAEVVVTGARFVGRREPYFPPPPTVGRDRFVAPAQNPFRQVRQEPVSTFSIDVDTASYSFVRASLTRNVLPQPAAVRAEEMVNYFPYDYAAPTSAARPFNSDIAVFPSPWTAGRKVVRIGIKGYAVRPAERPRANLVFLIDTSGSMQAPNKLPLLKQSLAMLVEQLDARDRVAIVAYAGSAGTVLAPTPASDKGRILAALDRLSAGGSTAGAEGIRQAYALAAANFDPRGVNRVMLATDGDFNVGITNTDELKGFVERERGKGVFLSVLGFGMGNYNDALMQVLAQNGNGAAAYIDTIGEARKTLVEEASATLIPIAKDVKIQVEFNPTTVAEYRLIGYETRMLAREDFDNDRVDAGDVGSGQSVTALYEIVPAGGPGTAGPLRYAPAKAAARGTGEYGFVKIRYKLPKSAKSQLLSTPIDRTREVARFADAPRDARFATGVAAFADLLRGGKYSGSIDYDRVLAIVNGARGDDPYGYRSELVQMVRAARTAPGLTPLER